MNDKRPLAIAAVIVAAIVAIFVVLLLTGGGGGESQGSDEPDDVQLGTGVPPDDTTLADISEATIAREGEEVVLTVLMATDVPPKLPRGQLSWRWEIEADGDLQWILTASVDVSSNASIIATGGDYSSSTVNDSLPGGLEIDGDRLTVRLKVEELPNFPKEFEWHLETTLDGDRDSPDSALATDMVPDEGLVKFSD